MIELDTITTAEGVAKLLELTPEKLDQIRIEQEALKTGRARLNNDEKALQRARALELHYRTTGNADGLAEALGMQGRYAEAVELAERPDLKEHFAELALAVETDDAMCACDPYRTVNGVRIPNQTDEFRGWTPKHNKVVPFIRCHGCGRLNARAPLRHLEELRGVRGTAIATGRQKPISEVLGQKP